MVNTSVFSGKSVVVCEDDVDMLESIGELLADCGAIVERFTNPALALNRITEKRPDLILSDISMPDMTGLEFLDALNSAGIEVPLIFLTGNADIATYRRGLIRGQFDFLTKPLVPSALLQAVQKALQFAHDSKPATGKLIDQISESVEPKKS